MERNKATKFLRDTLDKYSLTHWRIRLTTDLTKSFLGLCDYKKQTIILNAHHIDTHPEPEVIDTIYHEVAHALCPNHGHDNVWADKARELGCTNTLPCSHLSLNDTAIDAIRSGATIEIEYEEQVIRTPKITIQRFQELCPTCKQPAKEVLKKDFGTFFSIELACGHFIIKDAESTSEFEKLIFDLNNNSCAPDKHIWNKTVCTVCDAKKLYPFQIEGARALERANGRLAIFDQMGLGKTIQALAYLYMNRETKLPFLWVTKSGIKYQHASEIRRIFGNDLLLAIIDSSKQPIYPGFDAYIIGYDLFRRLKKEALLKVGFKAIVLDECQAIKNPDSSRTQAIRAIAREIPSIIPLSGTPWKNRGSEFFVVLNMLDPTLFWSYEHFVRMDCDIYYDGSIRKVGGIANPAKFKEKIAHIAIRREREQVLPELPKVNRVKLRTRLDGISKKLYEEEVDKLKNIANQAALDGTDETAEVKQILRGFLLVMRQIVGIAKVPYALDFAQEFLEETDRKLVIFVHHIEVGKLLFNPMKEWCAKNNLPAPVQLTGGMSSDERYRIQNEFNNHSRLLIASTLGAGEGLNLQHACSDCVVLERQWNPANEEQAEGRFIRIGQKADQVNANYIEAEDTIDLDMDGIVEPKRDWFDSTMNKDGYKNTWTETSLMDGLVASILRNK